MRKCSIEDCDLKHEAKGFCKRHYHQLLYHGEIPKRTRNDRNEFIIDGDICWVILRNNDCIEVARAKFLKIYYEQISDPSLKWHLSNNGYVRASYSNKYGKYQISLHQAIVQLSGQTVLDGYEIDHKDGDKLNCLDNNLRICTHAENMRNQKKPKNNTSGIKGVSWHECSKKWEV